MLLQLIFITFVVCTAEISEFHASFLCFFAHFGNFSLVSCDACDKFSFSSVVVSLSMSQTRGSCGHLKGNYDNHSSCLNCTGCFRSSCCSVCLLWPDSTWSLVSKRRRFSDRRKMGRTKEEKAKANGRRIPPLGILLVQDPILNRLLRGRIQPGPSPTVAMMTMHQLCLCHHRGVSGYAGTLGSLAVEAHTEHRVQVRGDSGPTVPPPPDPIPAIWQVSTGFRLLPRILRLRFLIRTPHRAILTRSRYQRIDHLGLSQNARWNDPILATSVKTPG